VLIRLEILFFSHFILRFYHSTLFFRKYFVVTFIFFSISLSRSRYLNHEFCKLCLDKVFFLKKTFCFPFNFYWFFFFLLYTSRFCFVQKYLFWNNISCMFGHAYFFFFFYSLCFIYIYLYYLLLILMNRFSGYKWVNISFCEIKYLDLHLSLNFFSFSFSYC